MAEIRMHSMTRQAVGELARSFVGPLPPPSSSKNRHPRRASLSDRVKRKTAIAVLRQSVGGQSAAQG